MKRLPIACLAGCVLIAGSAAPLLASDTVDAGTEQALLQALDDERRAAATYEAVLAKHGEILPFARIVEAEHRHIGHLLDFFDTFDLPIPDDPWTNRELEIPATVTEACRQAIDAEKRNVALYDEILPDVTRAEIREMFSHLQEVSRERHLPAFERCSGTVAAEGRSWGCCGGCGRRGGRGARRGAGPRCGAGN